MSVSVLVATLVGIVLGMFGTITAMVFILSPIPKDTDYYPESILDIDEERKEQE